MLASDDTRKLIDKLVERRVWMWAKGLSRKCFCAAAMPPAKLAAMSIAAASRGDVA